MRLTDLSIKRLKSPASGQKTYFDDALRGFGVRVSQGGTKSFVVVAGTARKRRTIGRYPDYSLADARKEARRILGNASFEDMAQRPSVPFTGAKDRFLADAESRTKPRTVSEYRRLLNRHFSYDKSLHEITRQDIMRVVEGLRPTPVEARAAFVAVRTMMNWCHKHGLIDTSPVPRLSFSTQARTRVLTDNELKIVWRRAEAYGYPYGRIVQLLILTGQRRGEIASLRRSWMDGNTIVFPAGFTKNKREHRMPMGPMVEEVISALPSDTDLLFPSRLSDSDPWNGWSKAKRMFDKPLQMAPYTLHDLRRTFSTNLAKLSVPIHVAEKLLNHVSGTVSGIAAVYNRYSYDEEMKEAIFAYEEYLNINLK